MKRLILNRLAPVLLCMILTLSLSACGGQTEAAPADETGVTETLSGSKGDGSGSSAPEADSEQVEASLALLRQSMAGDDRLACAVAYLGHREKEDTSPLTDWLRESCADLAAEMPFLLAIPAERILGGSDGDLFCFVPRDDSSTFAVNRVKWASNGAGVWPQNEEVLYRSEYAQPILVFSHYEEFRDEPDIEIHIMAENGADVTWYPELDDWGNIVLPTDWDGSAVMLDFAIFGYITGLDYPGDWEEPLGDGWWLPPTNEGLADTAWVCDRWCMELLRGSGDPEYFGMVNLYHQFEEEQDYQTFYTGAWRMTDDCLELMVSAGVGTSMGGCFPVLIDPSGEHLYIQESRNGVSPPFFENGETCMTLLLSMG